MADRNYRGRSSAASSDDAVDRGLAGKLSVARASSGQPQGDGTYFIVEAADRIAGCGGWSFRTTLYGGDESIVGREPARLDPASDAAKVRAMYTDPDFARRGVGRMILSLCEDAAHRAGFSRVELMATAAGFPLYCTCGYAPLAVSEAVEVDGVAVPLLRMGKRLI